MKRQRQATINIPLSEMKLFEGILSCQNNEVLYFAKIIFPFLMILQKKYTETPMEKYENPRRPHTGQWVQRLLDSSQTDAQVILKILKKNIAFFPLYYISSYSKLQTSPFTCTNNSHTQLRVPSQPNGHSENPL